MFAPSGLKNKPRKKPVWSRLEVISSPETSVNFKRNILHYIPEDISLYFTFDFCQCLWCLEVSCLFLLTAYITLSNKRPHFKPTLRYMYSVLFDCIESIDLSDFLQAYISSAIFNGPRPIIFVPFHCPVMFCLADVEWCPSIQEWIQKYYLFKAQGMSR
jgi:hypothetical protein